MICSSLFFLILEMECNMYSLNVVLYPKDALEALQSILEQLKKDVDTLNKAIQQQWALKDSVDALTPLSKKSALYTPISIPIEGLLSNVMICSRCGSRRQIRNVPFFSLSIPIARFPFSLLSLSRNAALASRPLQSPSVQVLLPRPHGHEGSPQPRSPHASRLSAQVHRARRSRRRAVRRVATLPRFNSSCGLLNAMLDPSTLTERPLSRDSVEVGSQNRGDVKELRKELAHSLHRVRSSHDFDAEFHLQNTNETLHVKEGRGTFQKFELIGRPPRTLLLHVQRKTAGMGLFSKQNTFVEFPAFFDLREFCLFSQSLPLGAMRALEAKEEREEMDVHRRLKRVASWKAEMKNPDDEATIWMLDEYFKPGGEQAGRRSRRGSFESVGSVYEVKSAADLSFSDDEGGAEYNDQDEDEEEEEWMRDSQAIHPYIRKGALRGGGAPLIYEMVSVIHHLGLGMGGHYVCYRRVRTDEGTKWYLMNDQIVREVSWKTVNTENM